jgi:uncharacterized membrane protein YcaP (DUF421 family)
MALLVGVFGAGVANDVERALMSLGRIAAIYLFLIAAFRLIGKRELSALSPLELITLMLIPEIASGTLNGEAPVLQALVGISALLLLVFGVSILTARFSTVARLTEAPPRVLVVDGQLCDEALRTERITPEELFAEMHKQGLAKLQQVKWAILESSGHITFVPEE